MNQHDTLTLRDALRSIQYDAATLADAQVIALQALNATYPARAALSATQSAQAKQSDAASEVFTALADHCPVDNGWFNGRAAQGAGDVANVPLAWQTTRDGLLAYVLQDDLHNRLTPRVIDIAYTAFMYGARGRNAEDGSQCDWFNDTKPAIEKAITKLRKDLFEASNAPTQPAAGADVLDAGRWRKLEQSGFELIQRRSGKKTLWAARPAFTNYEYELHETAAQAVDAIAASGRQE